MEFRNAEISSDGGLLAIRDFDEGFLLTLLASDELSETRTGRNIRHEMRSLIRQSVYSRLAGYEDVADAERMAQDPVMRMICGLKDFDCNAAGSTTMARFETEILTQDENFEELETINLLWPFSRHRFSWDSFRMQEQVRDSACATVERIKTPSMVDPLPAELNVEQDRALP